MTDKLTHQDVMTIRELFWQFTRDEITLTELESRVNEIAGKQMSFPLVSLSFPLVGNRSAERCWTSQHDKMEFNCHSRL